MMSYLDVREFSVPDKFFVIYFSAYFSVCAFIVYFGK